MRFWLIFLFPLMVFAQDVDIPIQDFLSQLFTDAASLKSLSAQTPLWLALIAFVIRVLTSLIKVSAIRQWIGWDKWNDSLKTLWSPFLAFLLVVIQVRPLTLQTILVGIFTGFGAVALHHLLSVIEDLPWISPTMKKVIDFCCKLLGGQTSSN
jgi:hypothetical protein